MTEHNPSAPTVTIGRIEGSIRSEHYFTAYDGATAAHPTQKESISSDRLKLLTFCVLVLDNGFTVTGESACVSAENFNAEKGREIARSQAISKMWPLFGFNLAQALHDAHIDREGIKALGEAEKVFHVRSEVTIKMEDCHGNVEYPDMIIAAEGKESDDTFVLQYDPNGLQAAFSSTIQEDGTLSIPRFEVPKSQVMWREDAPGLNAQMAEKE